MEVVASGQEICGDPLREETGPTIPTRTWAVGTRTLIVEEGGEEMELWRGESCIVGAGGAGEPAGAPGLGKGEAKATDFMFITTTSFCRRADVLQPRPIPSLKPLPMALGTPLSIFWGTQQDGEEQGHGEHCDLHLPLQCGECWVKLKR